MQPVDENASPARAKANAFPDSSAAADQKLESFGYKQTLRRDLGYFSSFALSFSIISITTGLFADYGAGLHIAGPAFIWTWLIVGAGQLLVALVFARLARQIPLSGYAYQWVSRLAGRGLGWWAGWMMIIQFISGMPGVCYALASYLVPFLGFAPSSRNVILVTVLTLISIALINQFGIHLASRVNDVSVIAEILGAFVVGVVLLGIALVRKTHPVGFLVTHPAQPAGFAYLGAFAFSSLMSAWTLTGFEGAANLAEETTVPEKQIPVAIVGSEVSSVLLGFLVLAGFTLAIPSLQIAADHPAPLLYIMGAYFPPLIVNLVMLSVFIAIYACALANLTAVTRMVWAMARDRQLPASLWLGRISAHKVPANAIWIVTVLSASFACWAKLEVVITGIAALAGYITYAIVVVAVLFATRKQLRIASQGHSVPVWLSVAALVWILSLLGFLSIPRSGWINSVATLIAIGIGGLVYLMVHRAAHFAKEGGVA